MKKLFIMDGVVVGLGIYANEGAGVSNADPSIVTVDVDESSPVTVGYTYDEVTGEFTEGHMPAPVDPAEWLIDIGPFFDRFGAAQIAILANPDAIVQALVKNVMARKWIDLKRADVGTLIDTLIAKGIAGVDAALKTAVLTTPVGAAENLALRKSYFS